MKIPMPQALTKLRQTRTASCLPSPAEILYNLAAGPLIPRQSAPLPID